MPDIRLQPIQRQKHLLLVREPLLQPLLIGQMQREEFFIAIELICYGALGHFESSSHQFLMNLWDTALLLIAQHPYQGNHVQSELPVRQRPPPFFFWTRGLVIAWTRRIAATIHFEGQTRDSL